MCSSWRPRPASRGCCCCPRATGSRPPSHAATSPAGRCCACNCRPAPTRASYRDWTWVACPIALPPTVPAGAVLHLPTLRIHQGKVRADLAYTHPVPKTRRTGHTVALGVDWGLNTLLSAGAARLHDDGTHHRPRRGRHVPRGRRAGQTAPAAPPGRAPARQGRPLPAAHRTQTNSTPLTGRHQVLRDEIRAVSAPPVEPQRRPGAGRRPLGCRSGHRRRGHGDLCRRPPLDGSPRHGPHHEHPPVPDRARADRGPDAAPRRRDRYRRRHRARRATPPSTARSASSRCGTAKPPTGPPLRAGSGPCAAPAATRATATQGAWRRIAARGLTHQTKTVTDRASGAMAIRTVVDKLEAGAVITPAPKTSRTDRSKTGPTRHQTTRPAPRRRRAPSPTRPAGPAGKRPEGHASTGRTRLPRAAHRHQGVTTISTPTTGPTATRSSTGRGLPSPRPRHPSTVGRTHARHYVLHGIAIADQRRCPSPASDTRRRTIRRPSSRTSAPGWRPAACCRGGRGVCTGTESNALIRRGVPQPPCASGAGPRRRVRIHR